MKSRKLKPKDKKRIRVKKKQEKNILRKISKE